MTLNLSEAKNHGCRPHLRGSVRRASGFVLTGNAEVTELHQAGRRLAKEAMVSGMAILRQSAVIASRRARS